MIISAVPIKAQGANEELHGQTPTQQGYIGQTIVPTGATANYTIYPLALLSITLNPVGVGQDALVKRVLI